MALAWRRSTVRSPPEVHRPSPWPGLISQLNNKNTNNDNTGCPSYPPLVLDYFLRDHMLKHRNIKAGKGKTACLAHQPPCQQRTCHRASRKVLLSAALGPHLDTQFPARLGRRSIVATRNAKQNHGRRNHNHHKHNHRAGPAEKAEGSLSLLQMQATGCRRVFLLPRGDKPGGAWRGGITILRCISTLNA